MGYMPRSIIHFSQTELKWIELNWMELN